MRHRWVIVVVSVAVMAASVPIYRQVKQEYIPSDVDESEFEVLVFGPEKMSLAAMDEAMQALAKEARETKGVALTLASAGGGFLSKVNQGYMYVRTVSHEERTVTARASLARADPRPAAGGVPGQLRPARRDGGAAAALPQVHRPAHPGPQHRRLQHRRRHLRHRPGAARARAGEARRVRRGPEGEGPRARRHRGRGYHAAPRQARAAGGHRPPAGGRPPRGHLADRHRAAPHGRRRRPGLALPRSRRSTTTTTCRSGCSRSSAAT